MRNPFKPALVAQSYAERVASEIETETGARALVDRLQSMATEIENVPGSPRRSVVLAQLAVARQAVARHAAHAQRKAVDQAVELDSRALSTQLSAAQSVLAQAIAAADAASQLAVQKTNAADAMEQSQAAQMTALRADYRAAADRLDAAAVSGTVAEQQAAAEQAVKAQLRVNDAGRSAVDQLAVSLRRAADQAQQAAAQASAALDAAQQSVDHISRELAKVACDETTSALVEKLLNLRALLRRSHDPSLPGYDWPGLFVFKPQRVFGAAGMERPGVVPKYALQALLDTREPLNLDSFDIDPESLPVRNAEIDAERAAERQKQDAERREREADAEAISPGVIVIGGERTTISRGLR